MANIYLGLTISGASLLPPIRWINGNAPGLPTAYPNRVDEAIMLDGSVHFNFRSKHQRRWVLSWEMITTAEFAAMLALKQNNRALYFQNNWEDATWRLVVITNFEYDPVLSAGSTACRYGVAMELREVR
jgi:hypothetical protein